MAGRVVNRFGLPLSLIVHCLFACSDTCGQQQPAEANTWPPEKCWAFVIGILEWEENRFAPFPKENRRDQILVDTLKKRGVPARQIQFLKDSQATTQAVHRRLSAFLKRPNEGDWVLIYYAGHGYHSEDHQTTMLASYDTGPNAPGMNVAALPGMIEQMFRGSHAIIAFDCCNSGAIAKAVNSMQPSNKSYAALASSHFNSGSTGNWTFTENLIYAFDGEQFMDDDGDGDVTLRELADNVIEDMTFAEYQMPQFAFTGQFRQGLVLAETPNRIDGPIGRRGHFRSRGEWYPGFIVDKDGDRRKVRYYGYDASNDEWLEPTDIRMRKRRPTKLVGATVEVEWSGQWYKAQVIAVQRGLHLVKYDGFGVEWNEWVPLSRIR